MYIDLTLSLYKDIPVFPGDPEVEIKQVHFLEKHGWNMATVSFPTHIATHVNVPIHMVDNGKTLDDYPLDMFMGNAVLYEKDIPFKKDLGYIFESQNITKEIVDQLIKTPVKFIALPAKHEFDIEFERVLLEHGQISFENLTNTEKLPKTFFFAGVPLKIQKGDGSPVRAYATI